MDGQCWRAIIGTATDKFDLISSLHDLLWQPGEQVAWTSVSF